MLQMALVQRCWHLISLEAAACPFTLSGLLPHAHPQQSPKLLALYQAPLNYLHQNSRSTTLIQVDSSMEWRLI